MDKSTGTGLSTSLADLLDAAMVKHKVSSGRGLGEVAGRLGLSITYSQINHIRAGTYRSEPRKEALDAIAALAGVSLDLAYEASGRIRLRPFSEDLPDGVDSLTPRQRNAVLTVIRAFLEESAG